MYLVWVIANDENSRSTRREQQPRGSDAVRYSRNRFRRLFILLFLPVSERSTDSESTIDPRNERFVCQFDTTLKVDSSPPMEKSFIAVQYRCELARHISHGKKRKKKGKACLRKLHASPRVSYDSERKIREVEQEETYIFSARLARPEGEWRYKVAIFSR